VSGHATFGVGAAAVRAGARHGGTRRHGGSIVIGARIVVDQGLMGLCEPARARRRKRHGNKFRGGRSGS